MVSWMWIFHLRYRMERKWWQWTCERFVHGRKWKKKKKIPFSEIIKFVNLPFSLISFLFVFFFFLAPLYSNSLTLTLIHVPYQLMRYKTWNVNLPFTSKRILFTRWEYLRKQTAIVQCYEHIDSPFCF